MITILLEYEFELRTKKLKLITLWKKVDISEDNENEDIYTGIIGSVLGFVLIVKITHRIKLVTPSHTRNKMLYCFQCLEPPVYIQDLSNTIDRKIDVDRSMYYY